jgi:hypothetical protein
MSIFNDLDADQVTSSHFLFRLLRRLCVIGEVVTSVTRSGNMYSMRIDQIYPKGRLTPEDLLDMFLHEGRTKENVRR